ncbi:MAG: hypothetical protein HFH87_11145, partial [Lachnospiraceae bacterium]|nr:hypothetical protein [Lachnospiraceae bacterium]
MKLHINRKKRKGIRRFISIALVLCMTFSIGSPYVTAEASNTTVESPMPEEKSAAVETGQNSESVVRPAEDNSSDTSQDKAEATGGDTKKDGAPADDDQNEKENINIEETPSDTTPAPDGTPAPETTQDPDSTGNPENTLGPDSTENPKATPVPETTENPEATPAPETTGNPENTQAPEKTESPAQTQTPEAVQSPKPEVTPEASQSPAPGQTPVPEIEEEDFSDLMSLDELTGLSMETAGATRFRAARVLGSERNYTANDGTWSFDTYYVNEADRYNVTKTDDFSLKYQMEFHASRDFEAGEVKIRIDGWLFEYRNRRRAATQYATPNDIGVPPTAWDDNGNPVANTSKSTSFNYYYTNAYETVKTSQFSDATPYLVFYNYKPIASGTNAAWQVLYSNLQLMEIADETSWSKMPQISIGGEAYINASANTLTGRINSSVSLNSVVKTPYYEAGRKYAPGLYTLSQVKRYVDDVDYDFIIDEGGKEKLNPAYRYVVWDVKITGSATQPWRLSVEDMPKVDGEDVGARVVGYKDHSDPTTVYNVPVVPYSMEYEAAVSDEEKSWGHRFWVVTAYPADKVEANTAVQNDIKVTLLPLDGIDSEVVMDATPSTWSYKNYDWSYDGNTINVIKRNSWSDANDTTEYTGWLEAYRRAREKGEDYGEIPFLVTSYMNGYGTTHYVNGDQLGEYKPGTSYTLTTTDDFLYVHTGEKGENEKLLGAEDYYFSSITIKQRDYGYDIYEDKMVDSERQALVEANKLAESFGDVKIYAMFARPAAGEAKEEEENTEEENTGESWELAGTVSMDEKGNATYSFNEDQIAREPYRVMAVHESIDYRTTCEIKVTVRFRHNSTKMGEIVNDRQQGAEYNVSPVIQFENLSGVMGIQKNGEAETIVCDSMDSSTGNTNYAGREELKTKTEQLYGNLLYRDNAFRDVSWLNMTSRANKKYTSKNDAKNNRVLVDYYLTAYDGYEIYDRSCLDYLTKSEQELMSPGRKHVVFYDLLPYGMQFDASTPVTAGRIKELDTKGDYMTRTRSWDSTQVSVTVDPDRDIIPDYKGTGRTMVAFHISYSGADSTTYTAKKWIEGWGVSFRAYYDW